MSPAASLDPRVASLDPRIAILEELRTADRIVAGAIATLSYAERQQGRDLLELPTTEGVFDSQTQRDNASAASDLNEAEAALRRVERRLALPPTTAEIDVKYWSVWADLAGGLFDLIPLAKLSHNVDAARGLQSGIRQLFASVREADARVAAQVEPLTDWDDGPSELAVDWHYNRGPTIIMMLVLAGSLVALFL